MTPYTLNLLDMAFTLYALQHGGVELNPLMRNPTVMVGWKVVVIGVLCVVLNHFALDGNKAARWGLRLCTAVYAVYFFGHLFFIFGGAF